MTFAELQREVQLVCGAHTAHVSDFVSLLPEFSECEQERPQYVRPVRAAFLSSYTIKSLSDVCTVRGLFHNLWVSVWDAPYNHVSQSVLDAQSDLYSFNPSVVFLFLDAPEVIDAEHLVSLLDTLLAGTEAYIVMSTFLASPTVTEERAGTLNAVLKDVQAKHPRVLSFDLQKFVTHHRAERVWYTKYVTLGDFRIDPQFFVPLAEELLGSLVAVTGVTKKCVVTDLDNTLWAGIIGEDGEDGIVPDIALQTYLKELYDKGVILAINSKNNFEDAMAVFRNDDRMVLRESHFAAWQINWEPKDQNIVALSEELNIGTDSMVFIDDDPFQRARVLESLPEVAVIDPPYLRKYAGFTSLSVTEEDTRRGAMYVEERKRRELHSAVHDEAAFLARLGLQVGIESVVPLQRERVSQLSQKTNQYNLTTRRYTLSDVEGLLARGWHIHTVTVRDVVGEYGLIGVWLVEPFEGVWRLDNFFMSCRVIGRGVEQAIFADLVEKARVAGAQTLVGEFIPTKKNAIGRQFFTTHGFILSGQSDEREEWEYDLSRDAVWPSFISRVI